MYATDILRAEHRLIEQMLSAVQRAASRLNDGEDVPASLFQQAAEYFQRFADQAHHGKEEADLFPALERAHAMQGDCCAAAMLAEHDEGRAYVRELAAAADRLAAGDTNATRHLVLAVRSYVNLLQPHIHKEDSVLFPIADAALASSENERLLTLFAEIDKDLDTSAMQAQYQPLLDTLRVPNSPQSSEL